jgi:hypothetical protein
MLAAALGAAAAIVLPLSVADSRATSVLRGGTAGAARLVDRRSDGDVSGRGARGAAEGERRDRRDQEAGEAQRREADGPAVAVEHVPARP